MILYFAQVILLPLKSKYMILVMFIVRKSYSEVVLPFVQQDSVTYGPPYRGSYMRTHVLLNLLNMLGKRDKMRGLLGFWQRV